MNNDILVILIGLMLSISVSVYAYNSFSDIFRKFEFLRTENLKIKKWKKIKAKILYKSINLDYVYEDCNYEDIKNYVDITEDEFNKKQLENIENQFYQGIHIEYGYMIDGEKYYSRNVSMIDKDMEMNYFYKVNKGDIVSCYVNPKEPRDSYLLRTNEKTISDLEWEMCKKSLPKLALAILFWGLWIFGAFTIF